MPVVDTELIQPLTAIIDNLLKRPGVVTMQSIKRLSEMYGFTTFVEFIKNTNNNTATTTSVINTPNNNNNMNTNMIRLSISGMILLIDIDFEIPIEMQIGLPLSPTVSNPYIGIPLSNSNIKGVSISSAVTPDLIDNKNYDFLFGFNEFSSCSDILFNNLKEKTLDSFNMNLRVLLLLDRLSKNKPNDLFTMFSELVWGLIKQNENMKNIEINNNNNNKSGSSILNETDWNDGIKGIGKVLANQDNKVGIFLQYWIDDRYINRWIKENKNLNVIDSVYKIHFKVKEILNYNKHFLEKENPLGEIKDKDKAEDITDNKEKINENQINDKDGDIKMNEDNNPLDLNINSNSNDNNDNNDNNKEHLFNIKNNRWKQDKKSEFSLIILEMCPPIWIPEDSVLMEDMEYDIINEDNENWSDNNHLNSDIRKENKREKEEEEEKQKQDQEQDNYQYEGEKLLDEIYKNINLSKGNGCIQLQHNNNNNNNNNIKLSLLTGCKMIKLFKVQIGDMNKLTDFVNILRNWCKLNNILRRTLENYHVVSNTSTDDTDVITLDDVFTTDVVKPLDNSTIIINVIVDDNFHVIKLDVDAGKEHVTLRDGLCVQRTEGGFPISREMEMEMESEEGRKSQSVEITESLLTI